MPLKVDNDDLVSSFFDATTKSFLIVFRTICGNSGRLSSRRCWSSETERFFSSLRVSEFFALMSQQRKKEKLVPWFLVQLHTYQGGLTYMIERPDFYIY